MQKIPAFEAQLKAGESTPLLREYQHSREGQFRALNLRLPKDPQHLEDLVDELEDANATGEAYFDSFTLSDNTNGGNLGKALLRLQQRGWHLNGATELADAPGGKTPAFHLTNL